MQWESLLFCEFDTETNSFGAGEANAMGGLFFDLPQ